MTDPVFNESEVAMAAMAGAIDRFLNGAPQPDVPREYGFALLVARFGEIDAGRVNYISNGNQEDMHALLREFLARAEGRYDETETRP